MSYQILMHHEKITTTQIIIILMPPKHHYEKSEFDMNTDEIIKQILYEQTNKLNLCIKSSMDERTLFIDRAL